MLFAFFQQRLLMQYRAQQGAVNLDLAIVADEAQSPELVHEMTDPRSGGANHLGQRLLTDIGTDRLRAAFFAEIGEQQEQPRQSPFAGIEQLIDEILLDPAVPSEEVGHEQFREVRLVMKG